MMDKSFKAGFCQETLPHGKSMGVVLKCLKCNENAKHSEVNRSHPSITSLAARTRVINQYIFWSAASQMTIGLKLIAYNFFFFFLEKGIFPLRVGQSIF